MALAADGRFAVLDDRTPMLVLFDASGGFVDMIGRRGQGPGEFGEPWEVVWDQAGDLLVLDPANARISRFGAGDSGLTSIDSRRIEVFGDGFCLLNDRIFVTAMWNGGMIHELGVAGNAARSFGTPPALPVTEGLEGVILEIAMEQLAPGLLFCDSEAGTLLEVGRLNPRVQLHDIDGTLRWSTELKDFFSILPVVTPDGRGLGMRPDERTGAHFANSVLRWGEDHVLIQYAHTRPQPDGQFEVTMESRLIRLDTGEEEERATNLPYLVAASGDRFIHLRASPVPQIVVLERR